MKIAMVQMCMSTSIEDNYKKTLDIMAEAKESSKRRPYINLIR